MDILSAGISKGSKEVWQDKVMIEKLSKAIVNYQSEVGTIQKEDINVYQYGYTLMAEVILNVSISVLLGFALDQIKEVIFFLCMFIPLRSFAGGYHAKKAWQCVVLSNLSIVMTLGLSDWVIQYNISVFIYLIGEFVLGVIIVYLSPVESENKKLDLLEKKLYKKYTTGIFLIELLVGIGLLIADKYMMCNVLFVVHIIQVISLLVVGIKQKKIWKRRQ